VATSIREKIAETPNLNIEIFAREILDLRESTLYNYFREGSKLEECVRTLLLISYNTGKPLDYFLNSLLQEMKIDYNILEMGSGTRKESAMVYKIRNDGKPCEHQLEIAKEQVYYLNIIREKNEVIITDKDKIIRLQDEKLAHSSS
ncbi:MAG: hypothetical protein ACXWW0_05340, partial [Bacteroidia bacterium]